MSGVRASLRSPYVNQLLDVPGWVVRATEGPQFRLDGLRRGGGGLLHDSIEVQADAYRGSRSSKDANLTALCKARDSVLAEDG